jgi:asparagine N-glycosylation enzyme membrane subunit Stt3
LESEVKGEEHKSEHHQQMSETEKRNLILFLAAVVIVIAIAVSFRLPMLSNYGFYEPDGYFHFSVVRQAVLSNFEIPQYMILSGWPLSARYPHHEPFGLYWTTLVPYFFLRFAGISYYNIMRVVPVLFGVLDVLAAYLLVRYLSKDKFFGLLVMLLIALNMGNAARTSALIYRGDSFVTVYLLLALTATLACFKSEERNRKIIYAVAAAIFLSLCNLVWTGAAFATAVYIFAFLAIIIFAFTFDKKTMVRDSSYMLLALFIWFWIVQLFVSFKWVVNAATFTGYTDFFMLFIPMVVGWYLVHYFTNKRPAHMWFADTPQKRFAISVSLPVIALLLIYFVLPNLFDYIFISSVGVSSGNFTSTIQEQQFPNYAFLYASFNYQNFTNPLSLIIILSTYYNNLVVLFWILLLAVSGIYLFMHTEHSAEGVMKGHARFKFEFNEATLVLISYFAITAYLQMVAIRYNSLISVPVSIFSAYTIYWVLLYLKDRKPAYGTQYALILTACFVLYFTVFINLLAASGWSVPWYQLLLSLAVSVPIAVIVADMLYQLFAVSQKSAMLSSVVFFCVAIAVSQYSVAQNGLAVQFGTLLAIAPGVGLFLAMKRYSESKLDHYMGYALVAFLIIIILQTDTNYITGLSPADQINHNFVNALAWLKNNSATNSVVLSLWPDGSVVEGVANRTSVTDSVGSQLSYKADPFAAWLYSSSPDPGFLLSNLSGMPDYLLVRSTWMTETGGIFTESGINVSSSNYGYNPFTSISEHVNASEQVYQFFGGGLEEDTVISNSSGKQTVASFLRLSTGIQPFAYIDFYNVVNGQYSIIKQTAFNSTNNQTFLIAYSTVPASGLYVNISGAYMLNTALAESNMVKFLFQCGSQACAWNNNVAALQLVYVNPDTKIFQILYNESNNTVKAATIAYPRDSV